MGKKRLKAPKDVLKNLEITVHSSGFDVWTQELIETQDGPKMIKHWVVDASRIFKDGVISYSGYDDSWNIKAVHDPDEKCLRIIKK